MAITLAQAQTMLQAWLDAELALATGGQEYEIWLGGTRRRLMRTDASEIRKSILYWQSRVNSLSAEPVSRVGYISPRG